MDSRLTLASLGNLAAIVCVVASCAMAGAQSSTITDAGFDVSYTAGQRDALGHPMGGTEMRNLAAYRGSLYAGNGYWMDRPGAEGRQPAQLLSLNEPSGRWRLERNFDETIRGGQTYRHLAVAALLGVSFTTGSAGQRLSEPVSMLLVGTWDLSGASQVFAQDGATKAWTAMSLPVPMVTSGIQQVRAFGFHRDRRTGVDHVFAGNDRFGIFSGIYDAAVAGKIRWGETPELAVPVTAAPSFPQLSLPRVSSFAECNDALYAAIGQQIYRRIDSPQPRWELLYTNPRPGRSETGLRGLTAIPAAAAGGAQTLLVAVEGTVARILRVDPATGAETTELDLQEFLDARWRTKVSYIIAGYNDMTVVGDGSKTKILIGIEAFLPSTSPIPAGHARVDGLEGGGWYLVRQAPGRYDLRSAGSTHPLSGRPLIATRAIAASPFAAAPDQIYFAGYDANKRPAHDTAWILRANSARVLAP